MNDMASYIKVVITITLAVIGWVVGHFFTTRRDRSYKSRELTVEYLIDAYRLLTNEVSHRPASEERSKKLENILSDIQLFGSREQVRMARELADEVAAGGEFELDPLINSLRDDLRSKLGLEMIEGNVKWLRFVSDKN